MEKINSWNCDPGVNTAYVWDDDFVDPAEYRVIESTVDLSRELVSEQLLQHNNEPSDGSSVILNNDFVRKTQKVCIPITYT